MKHLLVFIMLLFSTSISYAAHGQCLEQAIQVSNRVVVEEGLYKGDLVDAEIRLTTDFQRDNDGNIYEVYNIGWRVGPSHRILSKFIVEEGHCTLVDVALNG